MRKITFNLFVFLGLVFSWHTQGQIYINEPLDSGVPSGWSQEYYYSSTTADYLCEGSGNVYNNLYENSWSGVTYDGNITTPNYSAISNGTDTTVTFDWLSTPYSTNPVDYIIYVEYSTDDGTGWSLISSFAVTEENPCTTYSEVIPAASLPTGSDFKFRIRGEWQSGDSYFYLDNIIIEQVVSCPQPIDLDAINIDTFQADLSWTENGSASLYNVEVVLAGDAPTGASTDTGVANGFTKTGLSANTDYEYYVQADCTGGDLSAWSGPYAFTTLCDVFMPDYDADMSVNTPDCWIEANNGDATSGPTELGSGLWYSSNHNGTPSNAINLYTTTRSDWIISPEFDLSTAAPSELNIYVALTENGTNGSGADLGSDDSVDLLMTTDGGTTWTSMQTWTQGNVPTDVGEQITYDLSAITGVVQFAFLGDEGDVDDSEDVYFHVSQFRVRETPSCVEPSDLTALNISDVEADLSWTENGTASLYNVEVVLAGDTPTGTPTDTGVANGFTKSGLSGNTEYEYYVQADCTGGDLSPWVGPYAFTTFCSAIGDFTEGFESYSTSVDPDCWSENIGGSAGYVYTSSSDTNTGTRALRTGNSSTASAEHYIISPSLTDMSAGTHRLSFFMEASANIVSIEVGRMSDPNSTATFTVVESITWSTNMEQKTVYFTTPNSDDFFAIKISFGTSTYNYASFDDFVWEPSPSCIEPSNLTASSITNSQADLSWTENGSASLYNVEVVSAGDIPTGTATDFGVANGFTKSGLMAETDYEYYVQADCTGGDLSIWVGPFAFSTSCATVDADYSVDMSTHLPDGCWDEAGSGEVADGPMNIGSSDWKGSRAFTDDEGMVINSNVINLYQSVDREWLLSPNFDLDALGSVALLVKVAVTDYAGSGTSSATATDTMGSDDEVQLLMTNDNGVSWTNLTTWNAANQPAVTGTNFLVDLSGMTGVVQFAFFASDGTTDDSEDYDFHVGSFEVSANALSTITFENESAFTYFPNPVKNTLTLNAQNTIENVTMYNMLGQEVLRATPNAVNSELNMSSLQDGAYFVKVTIANITKTIKVIKQ